MGKGGQVYDSLIGSVFPVSVHLVQGTASMFTGIDDTVDEDNASDDGVAASFRFFTRTQTKVQQDSANSNSDAAVGKQLSKGVLVQTIVSQTLGAVSLGHNFLPLGHVLSK